MSRHALASRRPARRPARRHTDAVMFNYIHELYSTTAGKAA
jgi:hypothetical protein